MTNAIRNKIVGKKILFLSLIVPLEIIVLISKIISKTSIFFMKTAEIIPKRTASGRTNLSSLSRGLNLQII